MEHNILFWEVGRRTRARFEKTELLLAKLPDSLKGRHLRPFILGRVEGDAPGSPVVKQHDLRHKPVAAPAHFLSSRTACCRPPTPCSSTSSTTSRAFCGRTALTSRASAGIGTPSSSQARAPRLASEAVPHGGCAPYMFLVGAHEKERCRSAGASAPSPAGGAARRNGTV